MSSPAAAPLCVSRPFVSAGTGGYGVLAASVAGPLAAAVHPVDDDGSSHMRTLSGTHEHNA